MLTRTDTNEVFKDGKVIHSEVILTDITQDVVEWDLHAKLRTAIDSLSAKGTTDPSTAAIVAIARIIVGDSSPDGDTLQSSDGTSALVAKTVVI